MLILNGIHPGEPDGIDASMAWARDLLQSKNELNKEVVVVIIPVYNIGGCLNRSPYNRPDQNGPDEFGSRGNSQYLDLNRDFIKCDSKEAIAFTKIFQWIRPHLFVDNHVSDGADYPYTMTLATTQHSKLPKAQASYLNNHLEPSLFNKMKEVGFPMIPYVNVWGWDAGKGWGQFFDSPRYSSGYASLFGCYSFTAETHMLKPYADRVKATYALMNELYKLSAEYSAEIQSSLANAQQEIDTASSWPVYWQLDSSRHTKIEYKGYHYHEKKSSISQATIKDYDPQKTYTDSIPFYNHYKAIRYADIPAAYIIPQGWWNVIKRLKWNNVAMSKLDKDTSIYVQYHKILHFKSTDKPFEGHHFNTQFSSSVQFDTLTFRKGDYVIPSQQKNKRFIVETLDIQGQDSYLAWNFFDPILTQKEGYTDYALERIAQNILQEDTELNALFNAKLQTDKEFSMDIHAQLDFIHRHSRYFEKGYALYPVFKLFVTPPTSPFHKSPTNISNPNKQHE